MSENNLPCPGACLKALYQTSMGSVYQCNQKNCYWLEFQGEMTPFKVSDFLYFKKHVDRINLDALLLDTSPSADFTALMPLQTNRCFLLTVQEIIKLRELLDGAKFMIELNSLMHSLQCGTLSEALFEIPS
jgi:hypothetical protein